MRLLRRTLLCLVVGVTAFGAAGWGLRPRPNWNVSLDDRSNPLFVPSDPLASQTPIWIRRYMDRAWEAQAFRAIDGTTLTTLSLPPNAPIAALYDGRLLIEHHDVKQQETAIQLIDADDRTHDAVVHLPARWDVSKTGRRALRAWRTSQGLDCTVVELPSGEQVLRRMLNSTTLTEDCDLAPNGCSVAILEGRDNDLAPPAAVEVWDLTTGDRVQRLEFPRDERRSASLCRRPKWLDDGRMLECECVSAIPGERSVFWRLDVERGTVRMLGKPPDDAPRRSDDEPFLAGRNDDSSDREVWCAISGGDSTPSFTVLEGHRVVSPWRPLPFSLAEGAVFPMRRSGRLYGVEMHLVPGADAVVWQTLEPPLANSVPPSFRDWLPKSWQLDRPTWRTRLFVWTRDSWADVGLTQHAERINIRSDGVYVMVAASAEKLQLQSWPLPPRNPKPPALAVAALCMAGTWWLCAWRYRRRMRIAAVGAT